MTKRAIAGRAVIAAVTLLVATGMTRVSPRDFPISSAVSPPTEPAQQAARYADWLRARYAEIDRDLHGGVRLDKVGVVFMGDSITQFWRDWRGGPDRAIWDAPFADPVSPDYALNLGVAGDRTENVLLRLRSRAAGGFGQLDDPAIQPKVIVLMIGINNTWHVDEPVVDKVVAGNLAVIARLRSLRPHARIIVCSLLPAESTARDERYVRPINARLSARVARLGRRVSWLDVHSGFVRLDGAMRTDLFKDGVHPNVKGYAVWKALLLPALNPIFRNGG